MDTVIVILFIKKKAARLNFIKNVLMRTLERKYLWQNIWLYYLL